MTTVFAVPVFDTTVVVDDNELFKGQGSATQWAKRLAAEIGTTVVAKKIGGGWALCSAVDGNERTWGIYGLRIKQVDLR
jgi:hypothetical protein